MHYGAFNYNSVHSNMFSLVNTYKGREQKLKLDDLISVGNVGLVARSITKLGMQLFAVVKIHSDNQHEVLRTAMDEKTILSMLQQEVRKLSTK